MDDIGGHLEYFKELEQASRMLNHPGESLIFEGDFLYMVERVDICIDFLKGHVKICSFSIILHSYSFLSSDISRKQKFTS